MPFFTKKPVQIEARQYTGSAVDAAKLVDWILTKGGQAYSDDSSIVIATLEGDHRAHPGDWIIRGIKGEFYPCRADIFSLTYEAS
jgi:hypothetical protein